jgi:hypothetical protein
MMEKLYNNDYIEGGEGDDESDSDDESNSDDEELEVK